MKTGTIGVGIVTLAVLVGCETVKTTPPDPRYALDFAATNRYEATHYLGRTKHEVVSNETGVVLRLVGLGSTDPKSKDTMWTVKSETFAVTTNARFAVRIAMKGEIPPIGAVRPGASIDWLDGADKPLMVTDALGKDIPFKTQLTVPFRHEDLGLSLAISRGQVPPKAVRARLVVSVDVPNLLKGETAEITNLEYYEAADDGELDFGDTQSPEFELLTPTPCDDVRIPLRVRFKDESAIDDKSVTFEINGKATDRAEWKLQDGVYTYEPKEPWAMNSVVQIKARAADVLGFSEMFWGFVAITTNKVTHPHWSVRDDGVVLKNGEPFFPLGNFSVHGCKWNDNNLDRGIKMLKDNGLNCVHTYLVRNRKDHQRSMEQYHDLVAACAKHDVALLAEPSTRMTRHGKSLLTSESFAARDKLMADNLIHGRAYSGAQAFWGIGDDTGYELQPHELKRNHQFCKAVDPDILTASVDVDIAVATQAAYVPYADVLMMECYPIRKETPQPDEMAIFAKAMDNAWAATRMAGCANRSVMAVPQVFKGWTSWKRYPTKREVRTEYYLALACRARGIIAYSSYCYYGNEGPFNDPVHLQEYLEIIHEISALTPRLVKRDAARQPTIEVTRGPKRDLCDGAAIRCLLKEDGLLIAVNATAEEVVAEITLPSGKKLTHTFEPGGVFCEQ